MHRSLTLAFTIVCFFALVASASTATLTYTDSFAATQTNWGTGTGSNPAVNLQVQKFNPDFGLLKKITLTFHGTASGALKFESTDAKSQTVTGNLKAKVAIRRPGDASDLVALLPLVSTTDSVSSYDGLTDFAGASGRTYSNLAADSFIDVIPAAGSNDWNLFVGTDQLILPAYASAMSSITGGGNLVANARTLASADLSVTYTFSPFVTLIPEPSIGFTSMFALALLARRRSRAC